MRKSLQFLIAIFITQISLSQDFKSDFQQAFQNNDTILQIEVLNEWKEARPDDPELFTSFFNYYFLKSRKELVSITKEYNKNENLIIKDSLGKVQGYVGNRIIYDQIVLEKGIGYIDEGIELYPNRLDMRFGKIYSLGETTQWNRFTNEIIKTIEHSSKNDNQWTWTNNDPQNGEEFFLSAIQDYQNQLFNTGYDSLLKNMRMIAEEVLKYYPNHIESLSNLSVTYLLTGEYDKGIKPLLKAEQINPEDYIVLANIAHGYKLKGDNQKAIEYYKKTEKYGDEQAKEFAQKQLEELNH